MIVKKIYYLFLDNMKNYESIMAILDSGHYAVVKDDEGDYCVFTKYLWNVRKSDWYDDLETAKKYIWENTVDKQSINILKLEIYPLPREQPNIKEGDKVIIMENAREIYGFNEWCNEAKEMVNNGAYEVRKINKYEFGFCYNISTKDKSNYFTFPASCVCKVYKEEKEAISQE